MSTHNNAIRRSIHQSSETISALNEQAATLAAICDAVVDCLKAGGKLLSCGHGGSAADALHIAEELVGRFDADRVALPAVSLTADCTALTCIANDFGYDHVFARQIDALGQPGDVLVIFSTSGGSRSLALAVEAARQQEMTVIALLGRTGGAITGQADHELIVRSDQTARIQEAHTLILHLILEAVERAFVETA